MALHVPFSEIHEKQFSKNQCDDRISGTAEQTGSVALLLFISIALNNQFSIHSAQRKKPH